MIDFYFVVIATGERKAVNIVRPPNILCSYYYWRNKDLTHWIETLNESYREPCFLDKLYQEETSGLESDLFFHDLKKFLDVINVFLNTDIGKQYKDVFYFDETQFFEDWGSLYEHFFPDNNPYQPNIMLDSGAYTSSAIDIKEYMSYIQRHQGVLKHYINLDVIGDPDGSFSNFKTMKAEGLDPLPVFHYQSDSKWLEKYLDLGEKYICLGGTVAERNKNKVADWSKNIIESFPQASYHMLGSSTPAVMGTGIVSCDSSTYINKSLTQVYKKEKGLLPTKKDRTKRKYGYLIKYMDDLLMGFR